MAVDLEKKVNYYRYTCFKVYRTIHNPHPFHNMTQTTPALLFPAISLLLLAYTNRFLTLGQLIRQINDVNREFMVGAILRQVENFKKRLLLIKLMQTFGIVSFLLCTLSMFALFMGYELVGEWLFGISLVTLSVSLVISLYEVIISLDAIHAELDYIRPDSSKDSIDSI